LNAVVKPLEPPDSHYVLAAQGWLELGDHREAAAELEKIGKRCRTHPDVLELEWSISAAAKDWNACVDAAERQVKAAPKSPAGWIHRSFALHVLKRTKEAADLLLPAARAFPKDWLVRYNLACYACQMGNHAEAWDWLQNAFELGDERQIRLMALEDADLKDLRSRIKAMDGGKG
jgi:tetratricopeptide (TPR) repeat protein